jgi:hypothetical protein
MPRLATYREVLNMKGIGDILNKLHNVKKLKDGEFIACCPAHISQQKNHQNLTVTQKDDNILIHCFAKCTPESIVQSLGYEMADLFIKPDEVKVKSEPKRIVATYDYQDENGQELYQVVRYQPKDFIQRHRNGGGEWIFKMDGIRRVLYHLPEILRSHKVYLVEGEKDADNLIEKGLVATTSPGGASAWKPEYSEYLRGKSVVLIPDKDSAGYAYAKDVIHSIEGKALAIKVIILPGAGIKDVSDWLQTQDDMSVIEDKLTTFEQDVDVLLDTDKPEYLLKENEIVWNKPINDRYIVFSAEKLSEERTGIHARVSVKYDYIQLVYSYFNIERTEDRSKLATNAYARLKGDIKEKYSKDDLHRDMDSFCSGLWESFLSQSKFRAELVDGFEVIPPLVFYLNPYILEGGGTIIFAPPGRGKSNIGLSMAISIDAGLNVFGLVRKAPVLYINLERAKFLMQRRLTAMNKALGLPPQRRLLMINAKGQSLNNVYAQAKKDIKQYGVKFIILDSISRGGFGDLNENKTGNQIIDALNGLCETWAAIGHTPRASEDHLTGSMMFDAGADVLIQLLTERQNDGTLGLGFKMIKQNDIPEVPLKIFALEFDDLGVSKIRQSKPGEFVTIESQKRISSLDTLKEWMLDQEGCQGTTKQAAEGTGLSYKTISDLFNHSGFFVRTVRDGKNQFYGVKRDQNV